jgi:GMP synthase (glutamine-hydrolysing)
MVKFVDQKITRIRKMVVDKGRVLGALSGGVDWIVAAKLMHEAIGDRCRAVLVNNGVVHLNKYE